MKCTLPGCEVWPAGDDQIFCRPHLMRLAWTCYGKRRRNRDGAKTMAKKRGQPYAPYLCPVCSLWHVGRQRPATPEHHAEAVRIIRQLRQAGCIRILAAMAEQWDPLAGALRQGAWTDKVKII